MRHGDSIYFADFSKCVGVHREMSRAAVDSCALNRILLKSNAIAVGNGKIGVDKKLVERSDPSAMLGRLEKHVEYTHYHYIVL